MKQLRNIMVLWLVLAYSGQALASAAMPCSSMVPASASTGPHAGHHMPAGDVEVYTVDAGCCDGGQCSMSQCQASPALISSTLPRSHVHAEAHAGRGVLSSPIRPSYSLFKPPISL